MRILIRHRAVLRKFMVLEASDRDGSQVMVFRRDGDSLSRTSWIIGMDGREPEETVFDKPAPKNKRITIHQSGRVNYHQNRSTIYIAPLTRTAKHFQIYAYRVPSLDRLDVHDGEVADEDFTVDFSEPVDGAVSFSIFIGPTDFEPQGYAVKLLYKEEGYAIAIQVDPVAFSVPEGLEEHFTTLMPQTGLFDAQQMAEDEAMVAWHQALTGNVGPILYTPNGEGVVRVIFGVPMRAAPRFSINLADPDLYVSDQDIQRDPRSERVMLKFRIRHRSSGEIVRQPVEIVSFELDAEL